MKTLIRLVTLALVLLAVRTVRADEVSFQFFYDSLGSSGTWITVGDCGNCWQPPVQDSDWQPYTSGYWADTDDGWMWVSDEPWGWATYHYGRWVNIEGRGWCWIPGYTWGPAWVSWRYGDGYCGWAPLPPRQFRGEVGPGWYNFCSVRYMGAPSMRSVIIHRSYNYTYMNRTSVIRPQMVGGHNRYMGPPVAEINRSAQRPIPHYSVQRNTAIPNEGRPENFRPQANGGTMTVFAPSISRNNHPASPVRTEAHVASPVVNDGNNVYRPPQAGVNTPPSVVPTRWMNRSAVSSVYKNNPAPPSPSGTTIHATSVRTYQQPVSSAPAGNYSAPVRTPAFHFSSQARSNPAATPQIQRGGSAPGGSRQGERGGPSRR